MSRATWRHAERHVATSTAQSPRGDYAAAAPALRPRRSSAPMRSIAPAHKQRPRRPLAETAPTAYKATAQHALRRSIPVTKVMLITGASRGIGAATARLAARRGYDVAVNYAGNKAAADAVVADIRKAGRKALAIQADVGKPEEIARLFKTVDAEFGAPRCLLQQCRHPRHGLQVRRHRRRPPAAHHCRQHRRARSSPRRRPCGACRPGSAARAALSSTCRRWPPSSAAATRPPTTPPPRAPSTPSRSALPRRWRPKASACNAVRPGLIDTDIHASTGIPDRVERLKGTGAHAARRHGRGGGGGRAVALLRPVLLLHRARCSTSRAAAGCRLSSRNCAKRKIRYPGPDGSLHDWPWVGDDALRSLRDDGSLHFRYRIAIVRNSTTETSRT